MTADTTTPVPGAAEETLDERADTAWHVAYGAAGYAKEDGSLNRDALADKLLPRIQAAVVESKADRARVAVKRRELVREAFPEMVGPEGWADTDDPALAEQVYKRADQACWGVTDMSPTARIQRALNGDSGLVLVRTQTNPDKTWAVYVTHDIGCLREDVIKKQHELQKKRADKDAALTAMMISRLPDHAQWFHRDSQGGLRVAAKSAEAITAAAVQMALLERGDDAVDTDDDAGE